MNRVKLVGRRLTQFLNASARLDEALHKGSPDVRPIGEFLEHIVFSVHRNGLPEGTFRAYQIFIAPAASVECSKRNNSLLG